MTEKKKRGRPPGSGKKGSKNKPKEVAEFKAAEDLSVPDSVFDKENITDKLPPEPTFRTTPMSNWAIENRKNKLGLKD